MFNQPILTPDKPKVNAKSLFIELFRLNTEQQRNNFLRTQFIDPEDVVQFMAELSDEEFRNLISQDVKFLQDALMNFKEYLQRYLHGSNRRIQQMEARNRANATELVEHVGETEVERKLLITRGRISQAMRFANKSINGKSLKDVAKIKDRHELSPEQTAGMLKILQARFEDKENLKRHKGMEWANIRARLEANPEKLWALNEMEINGHEPDVIDNDEKTGEYIFCTCSVESPVKHRNLVYDKAAEEALKILFPHETCNGNVVDTAAAMGTDILDRDLYLQKLQKVGNFDDRSWSWLKTQNKRLAPYGRRHYEEFSVVDDNVTFHHIHRGFRALVKV
jgi:hypothetical protein